MSVNSDDSVPDLDPPGTWEEHGSVAKDYTKDFLTLNDSLGTKSMKDYINAGGYMEDDEFFSNWAALVTHGVFNMDYFIGDEFKIPIWFDYLIAAFGQLHTVAEYPDLPTITNGAQIVYFCDRDAFLRDTNAGRSYPTPPVELELSDTGSVYPFMRKHDAGVDTGPRVPLSLEIAIFPTSWSGAREVPDDFVDECVFKYRNEITGPFAPVWTVMDQQVLKNLVEGDLRPVSM